MHSHNSNSQTWPWLQSPSLNHHHPSYPLPFVDPFVMQQLWGSQAHAMPWCGNTPMQCFYMPFCVCPVHQEMAQQYQDQYRPPSSGPSRSQHSRGHPHKTEAQSPYHIVHESSGTIARNHSTGIHLGMTRMDANNSGTGGAWRPPSGNPSMVSRDSTQQTWIKPYKRDRSGSSRSRRSRTDKVDPSVYEIPIVDSGRDEMWFKLPASMAPTPASATACTKTTRNMQKQRMEEDDFA